MSNRPNHADNRGSAGHYERQTSAGRAEFIAQRLAQITWWRQKLVEAANTGDVFAVNECVEAIRDIYEERPEIAQALDAELLKQAAH